MKCWFCESVLCVCVFCCLPHPTITCTYSLRPCLLCCISPRTQLLSPDHIWAKLGLISRCGQNTRLQSTHNVLPGSTVSVQGPHYHPKPRHQQRLVYSRPQFPKHTISFTHCLSISITLGELPFQHTVHQRQTFATHTHTHSASQEYTVHTHV